jgi:hypothetical protein
MSTSEQPMAWHLSNTLADTVGMPALFDLDVHVRIDTTATAADGTRQWRIVSGYGLLCPNTPEFERDLAYADAETLEIKRLLVGPKPVMVMSGVLGTREVLVPWVLKARPALEPLQYHHVLQLVRNLTAFHGDDVVVECGLMTGIWYVLSVKAVVKTKLSLNEIQLSA